MGFLSPLKTEKDFADIGVEMMDVRVLDIEMEVETSND